MRSGGDEHLRAVIAGALAASGLAEASLVLSRVSAGGADRVVEIRADAQITPASMIKVPIAAELAASWAEGRSAPGDLVAVGAANMTHNDAPSPLVPGYRAGLEELGRLMLTRSDNVATNMLVDVLGRERINARCRQLGLQATAVRRKLSGSLPLIDDPEATGRNAHPAADAALLFEAIALERAPGSAWLSQTLAAAEWNGKLSRGLQPGDRFAHKTGDTDEVSHDGGILTTAEGSRYVLVVYAPGAAPEGDDDSRLTRLMRALRPSL